MNKRLTPEQKELRRKARRALKVEQEWQDMDDFAALEKVAPEAWKVIGATFQEIAPTADDEAAPSFGAVAPFTENLLRHIIPLTSRTP